MHITPSVETTHTDFTVGQGITYYYVVTALDRLHNESVVSNTAALLALPLQLQSFTVQKNDAQSVLLNFTTSNEVNVSHFEIERAHQNQIFQTVTTLTAKNNSLTNNYSLVDTVQAGKYLYRIKMVDKDATISYSQTIAYTVASRNNWIKVYPTSIKKGASIKVENSSNNTLSKIQFSIVHANGAIVQRGIVQNERIQVDANLQSGLYVIQLNDDNGNAQHVRLLIQ